MKLDTRSFCHKLDVLNWVNERRIEWNGGIVGLYHKITPLPMVPMNHLLISVWNVVKEEPIFNRRDILL